MVTSPQFISFSKKEAMGEAKKKEAPLEAMGESLKQESLVGDGHSRRKGIITTVYFKIAVHLTK